MRREWRKKETNESFTNVVETSSSNVFISLEELASEGAGAMISALASERGRGRGRGAEPIVSELGAILMPLSRQEEEKAKERKKQDSTVVATTRNNNFSRQYIRMTEQKRWKLLCFVQLLFCRFVFVFVSFCLSLRCSFHLLTHFLCFLCSLLFVFFFSFLFFSLFPRRT